MSVRTIKAVMFDLDGTLLDTAPEFVQLINQLLAEDGRPLLPAEAIRAQVSNGAAALIRFAFGSQPGEADFEPLRQRLLDRYLAQIGSATVFFPGIDSLLQKIHQRGLSWGIATNKPALYTHALLKNLDLQPAPASVICPDDVQFRKPHPESLFLAASQLGCKAEEIVYIGDHKRDIDCGRDAGAVTIAAAFGYLEPGDAAASWQADYCVQHAADIWPIIDQLMP